MKHLHRVSVEELIEAARRFSDGFKYPVEFYIMPKPGIFARGYCLQAYCKKYDDYHPLFVGGTHKQYLRRSTIEKKLKNSGFEFSNLETSDFVY